MHFLRPLFFALILLGIVGVPVYVYRTKVNPAKDSPHVNGTDSSVPELPTTVKNVYVIAFNPTLQSSGKSLSQTRGWRTPISLFRYVDEFMNKHGFDYVLADYKDVKDLSWYPKPDGFTYTESTYLDVLDGKSKKHDPDRIDMQLVLNDPRLGICSKVKNNGIDEVWLIGGPWFGFHEWYFVGPSNFADMVTTQCGNKMVPIMGLSYEASLPNAVHSFMHRFEFTLSRVISGVGSSDDVGYTQTYSPSDDYGMFVAQPRHTVTGGCGNIHYPPNTTNNAEYKYNSKVYAKTYCELYKSRLVNPYTKEARPSKDINCSAWGCTAIGYYDYWMRSLPRLSGNRVYSDRIIYNDWTKYLLDMTLYAQVPADKVVVKATSGNFVPGRAEFNYGIEYLAKNYYNANLRTNASIDISTTSDMSDDVYYNFTQNSAKSPVVETNITWDKYSCGRTLFWRVRLPYGTSELKSNIVKTTVVCN